MRKTALLMSVVLSVAVNAQRMTDSETHSAYIQAVDEYVPAPGQFVNDLPIYEDGDDAAAMAAKCTAVLANDERGLVSLGGWGGYITFHFDHSIANVSGERDIFIRGNAIQSMSFTSVAGGSSEPGIIMVSKDTNNNGLPDDEWYEISGSADVDSVGLVDYGYSVTYRRNAMQDIPWTDNRNGSGVIPRINQYHSQEYYPQWITADEMTFTGTRLPRNAYRHTQTVNGQEYGEWVFMFMRYGYADNQPNAQKEACSIDIDWAVDAERKSVKLDFVDFVRVYTGINQVVTANIGETSTEISGAEDLHLEASLAAIKEATGIEECREDDTVKAQSYYSLSGQQLQQMGSGLNIVRMSNGKTRKVLIK